ncbi:MAG: ABC transporter ATP-binding protein [Candidatus Bathyarchaeia archaeon]
MAKLAVEHLRKLFGDFEAVRDVSFKVEEKETLCLLGPSGCGKTTTLRMIAGLEEPSSGEVFIDGELVNDLPPQKRGVGLVFQDYAVFPHMSVRDNLAFGLSVRNVSSGEREEKVREVAEILGLDDILDRSAKGLGLSEMQRVAIGRCLAVDPRVLLLDEPLSNVDARVRERMRAELKRIQREIGITTVYVTHDQLEAMTLGDKIAVMKEGLIEQMGTPGEIYDHPNTLYVASFIGSPGMNLIECNYGEVMGGFCLLTKDFNLNISEFAGVIKEKASSPQLIMGIRPEDLLISTEKSTLDDVQGEISLVELLGKKAIYHISFGEITMLAKVYAIPKIKAGSKAWITFNKRRLHVFDKKTGHAII